MSSTTFFIIFIPILAVILLAVNLILAPHNPYEEKDSVFECGFHSFLGQNRTQFSVSFFIFGLLFLLFDLEVLLMYPYSVSSYGNGIYGLSIMMLFFLLLTLGFVFELGKNALTIDSRQSDSYRKGDTGARFMFFNPEFIKNTNFSHSSMYLLFSLFAEPLFIINSSLLQSSVNPSGKDPSNNTSSDQDMPDRPLDEDGHYDSDDSDQSSCAPLSAEAAKRNEEDLQRLEDLQDKERQLTKMYENAEHVLLYPDGSKISEEQHNEFIDDNEPDLDDLSAEIIQVREDMRKIEEKMESRRQADYEPSERSDDSPDSSDNQPAPEPNNQPASEPNNQSVTESGDIGESTEHVLPIMFILSTEIPVVSILCISYKLYKIDFFKILRSYFEF